MVFTHFLNCFYECIFSLETQKWYQNVEIVGEGGLGLKKTMENSIFGLKKLCQFALVNI